MADAAMISDQNVEDLTKASIHYVVRARLSNISKALFTQVDDTLQRKDGSIIRLQKTKDSKTALNKALI